MELPSRQERHVQLRCLRSNDPAGLIALFREVAGLRPNDALPPDVSFPTMIIAILDGEESSGKLMRMLP